MKRYDKKFRKALDKTLDCMIPTSCIILVIAFILTDANIECSGKPFVDIRNYTNFENQCITNMSYGNKDTNGTKNICLPTVVFFMEENLISMKNQMRILVNSKDRSEDIGVGTFIEKVDPKSSDFRYRYKDLKKDREFVVGLIDKKRFLSQDRYIFTRCSNDSADRNNTYRLEEKVITFDDIEYKLYKNDILIGESSEDILTLCKSAVQLIDNQGNLIALLERGCAESFLRDRWKVTNYRPDLVDDYVVGFLGYITTLREAKEGK